MTDQQSYAAEPRSTPGPIAIDMVAFFIVQQAVRHWEQKLETFPRFPDADAEAFLLEHVKVTEPYRMLASVTGHTTFHEVVRQGASGFKIIVQRNELECLCCAATSNQPPKPRRLRPPGVRRTMSNNKESL